MKILAVDHNALDPTNRIFYDELSRQPGIELRLIVPSNWYDNYNDLAWDVSGKEIPYDIVPSKTFFSRWTHRLLYTSLRSELRYFDPDILFMNAEPENYQTFHAAFLLSADHYRAKLVFTSWRNIDHSVVGFPYKLSYIHKLAEQFVLDGATHGIVFNNDAKKIFAKIGFPKTTVIPPFVDTSVFHKMERDILPIPGRETTFTIGYIGRVIPEKGIDLLLRAASELPFPASVIIIGNGKAKPSLQKLAAELHIADRVLWIPPQSRASIPSYLNALDAVVLPSRTGKYWKEQFGRILIEAMACGTPVIGSDSGEIPNVIGDAGLVFPEGDAIKLREKIIALHDDANLRSSLIMKGKEKQEKMYSLPAVLEKHLEVFRKI